MYTRQITSEQTYMITEARHIINREGKNKRELLLCKVKQKALGLLAIGLSIASPLLLDGDATISLLMLPLGLYLLFTRKIIV